MLVIVFFSIVLFDLVNGDLYNNYEYAELDGFNEEYTVDYNTLHADSARIRRIPAENTITPTNSHHDVKETFKHTVSPKIHDNFTSPKRTKKDEETSKKIMPLPQYFDDYNVSPDDLDEMWRQTIVHIDAWSTEGLPPEIKAPIRPNFRLLKTSKEAMYDNATNAEYYYDLHETTTEIPLKSSRLLKPTLSKSEIIYSKIPSKSPILPSRSSMRTSSSSLTDSLYEYETFIQNPEPFYSNSAETSPKLSRSEIPVEKITDSTYEYETYIKIPTRMQNLAPERTPAIPNILTPYYEENNSPTETSHYYEAYVKNRKPTVPNRSPKLPTRSPHASDKSSDLPTRQINKFESYVQNPRRWYMHSEKSSKLADKSPLHSERTPQLNSKEMSLFENRPTSSISSHSPHRSPKLPLRSSPQMPDRSPNPNQEEIVLYRYDTYNDGKKSPTLPQRSSRDTNRATKLEPEDMYRYETYNMNPRKSSVHPPRRSPKIPKSTPNKSQKSDTAISVSYQPRYEPDFRPSYWHTPERSLELPTKTSPESPKRSSKLTQEQYSYLKGNRHPTVTTWRKMGPTRLLDQNKVELKPVDEKLPKLQDNTIDDEKEKEEDYIPEALLRHFRTRNNDTQIVFRDLPDSDKSDGLTDFIYTDSPIQTTKNQPKTTGAATDQPITTGAAANQPTTAAATNQPTTDQPTTTQTTTTMTTILTTTMIRYDIARFLAIIANLTYDYDTNLTQQVNETLISMRWPTCGTPAPPTTTTTTPPPPMDYSGFNGTLIAKCFVCGLESEAIPYEAHCADAFAGDFIPLVPQDPRARSRVARYRKYCRLGNVRNYHLNSTYPRAIYGSWTGGCAVRWTDVTGVYTQRTCRNKYRPTTGRHFASKRMAKLEKALLHEDNGCIISPVATLLPLSRGVSLFARFHACVCTGSWCNTAQRMDGACVRQALLLVALAQLIY